MLTRLEINNFAVIEHAVFEPTTGFNVISGETGAGKSLLIDAIGLIMGCKASKDLIRSGKDEAFVEAIFDLSDNADSSLYELLSQSGIDTEEGMLIISRKISLDGKSIARINGRTVVLAVLRGITSYLVDIHGQHDTQKIFDDSYHCGMLDAFSGSEVQNSLNSYRTILQEYKNIVLEIRRLSSLPDSMDARRDYLNAAIAQIREAAFEDDEEEKLIRIRKESRDDKRRAELINQAEQYVNSEDSAGMDIMARFDSASKSVTRLMEMADDPQIASFDSKLQELIAATAELSLDLKKYSELNEYDPEVAARADSRYGLLMDLKGKYNCSTVEELNKFAYSAEDEIKNLEDSTVRLAQLRKERSSVEKKLLAQAEELSAIRHEKAKYLSDAIAKNLSDLEMPDAKFDVQFVRRSKERFFSGNGIEDITFMFSANPGQPPRNLALTASGGEASRIMLAIKNILSEADTVPTLIFDEIDTGVSGKSSIAIAHKLKSISANHQVLCVTHTSQLAAAADTGFLISKAPDNGTVATHINKLTEEEQIKEVSRLLSGTSDEESILLAKQMINSMR